LRPELKAVASEIRSAELLKKSAQSVRLPRLSLSGGWSYQGLTPASSIPTYQYGAFLDVPLVYLSVRLMPDIHPVSVQLAPEMKLTLVIWFVPVLMLAGGLIVARFRKDRPIPVIGVPDNATAGPFTWAGGVS